MTSFPLGFTPVRCACASGNYEVRDGETPPSFIPRDFQIPYMIQGDEPRELVVRWTPDGLPDALSLKELIYVGRATAVNFVTVEHPDAVLAVGDLTVSGDILLQIGTG